LGEGEATDLSPVDLYVLGGQSFDVDRDAGVGRLLCMSTVDAPRPILEGRVSIGTGLLPVLARSFESSNERATNVELSFNPRSIGAGFRDSAVRCKWPVKLFAQHPADGRWTPF
jgi:hypothetical protein